LLWHWCYRGFPAPGQVAYYHPEDLEKATPKIEPGDWVVMNTGWQKYWRYNNFTYSNHYPGLGAEAAQWLIDKKVKGV
jgi:kynurenine formamidase